MLVAEMGEAAPNVLLKITVLPDAGVAKSAPLITSVSPGESTESLSDVIVGFLTSTSVGDSSEPHEERPRNPATANERTRTRRGALLHREHSSFLIGLSSCRGLVETS
jgi:hypothetical protein